MGLSDLEQNLAANKGKMAGRDQFDTHLTGIGLKRGVSDFFGKQPQQKHDPYPRVVMY